VTLDLGSFRAQLSILTTSSAEVPNHEAASLAGELARAQAALLARATGALTADSTPPRPPPATKSPAWDEADLLTVDEAAILLRVSPRWLYRHARTLPFARKLSRKVLRFSRAGIARWLATKRL